MKNSALVVIDLQNDITKNHKEIIAYANKLSARPEGRRAGWRHGKTRVWIRETALLHTARHVSYCDDGRTEKNSLWR